MFDPFPADVANERRVDWSDWLVWPDDSLIDLGCLYCRRKEHSVLSKNTQNWLKTNSVYQKLCKIQLTRVWELFTRRWNTWPWERHCVLTAGGERVNGESIYQSEDLL
jgi:hypothetical protein